MCLFFKAYKNYQVLSLSIDWYISLDISLFLTYIWCFYYLLQLLQSRFVLFLAERL